MSTLSESDIEKIADTIGKKSKKQDWHKHPLLLLFMSLIFTTIAGTALTTVIKNVDFKKRQLLLKQEKVLEQKIRIIGELNQEFHHFMTSTNHLSNTYWQIASEKKEVTTEELNQINITQRENDIRWKRTLPFIISQMQTYFNDEVLLSKATELQKGFKSEGKELSVFALTRYFYSIPINPNQLGSDKRQQMKEFASLLTNKLNGLYEPYQYLQSLMLKETISEETYVSQSIFVETWDLIFGNSK
mgnify:FL=1